MIVYSKIKMFTAALWNSPQLETTQIPATNMEQRKGWYLHTTEYFIVTRMNNNKKRMNKLLVSHG